MLSRIDVTAMAAFCVLILSGCSQQTFHHDGEALVSAAVDYVEALPPHYAPHAVLLMPSGFTGKWDMRDVGRRSTDESWSLTAVRLDEDLNAAVMVVYVTWPEGGTSVIAFRWTHQTPHGWLPDEAGQYFAQSLAKEGVTGHR